MTTSLGAHSISSNVKARTKTKRLGRGNGSGKGTTAARGQKGQNARSGGRSGNRLRGLKKAIQKVPKHRGFKSMHPKAQNITLGMLEKLADKTLITSVVLQHAGYITDATGSIKKAVKVQGCLATKGAIKAIEKVGGSILF